MGLLPAVPMATPRTAESEMLWGGGRSGEELGGEGRMGLGSISALKPVIKDHLRDFPDGPVVENLRCSHRGRGFNPGLGKKDLTCRKVLPKINKNHFNPNPLLVSLCSSF